MASSDISNLLRFYKQDYNPVQGLSALSQSAPRLTVSYDAHCAGQRITHLLDALCNDPAAAELKQLIIGGFDYDQTSGGWSGIVHALAQAAPKLPKLSSLFIGDIDPMDQELSDIPLCDMSPVLKAYPQLETFWLRGGKGLSFGQSLNHPSLGWLFIESANLPTNVIKELGEAVLPNLTALSLWLGPRATGFQASVEDFAPLFLAANFPKLVYLGILNSDIADDLAKAISVAPILDKITQLDFSKGTFGDEGARAMLNSRKSRKLQWFPVYYHYVSEAVETKLRRYIAGDLNNRQIEIDGRRYVEHSD